MVSPLLTGFLGRARFMSHPACGPRWRSADKSVGGLSGEGVIHDESVRDDFESTGADVPFQSGGNAVNFFRPSQRPLTLELFPAS